MIQKLYNRFIAPRQRDPDTRNRVIVLHALFAGTLLLLVGAIFLLLYDIIALGMHELLAQFSYLIIATLVVGALYHLSRSGRYRLSALLLVLLYFLLGTLVLYQWSIMLPTGILVYGLVIVISGILLGPMFSVYSAALCSLLLVLFPLAAQSGVIDPDTSWLNIVPTEGDAFSMSLLFMILALVSWLFNFQMHRSLQRATKAETALTKQKALLETTVEERTSELQAAQLEKIQQMYRFAELGQLSTALLHDLANHLSTLTLDIEGLKGQGRSVALGRAKRSIRYIDDMVLRVRDQLAGKHQTRPFAVATEIEAMVAMLRHRAQNAGVTLVWQPPADKKGWRILGEPIRFRQLLANLLSNGIDAYEGLPDASRREVKVTITAQETSLVITVTDWGKGIPNKERGKLFEPFYSTKKAGMGMGLFIVKQIVEEHFLGSIILGEAPDSTAFIITLPRAIK